jgi:predicted nuclease of predicted toxin-antitoxin system
MKFLIDECLSPKLAELARSQGFGESSHLVWLGRAAASDWNLIPFITAGDWTFVTRNAIDFRGSSSNPGAKGQYARLDLHAGLICLNAATSMTRSLQLELFSEALRELALAPDLVNQVLEVTLEPDGDIRLIRYALPSE